MTRSTTLVSQATASNSFMVNLCWSNPSSKKSDILVLSSSPFHCIELSLVTAMLDPETGTCASIRHSSGLGCNLSDQTFAGTSKIGLRIVHIAVHITFDVIAKVNCIFVAGNYPVLHHACGCMDAW